MNERLQRLREVLRMEWGELAEHLQLSRSMLDFARKGLRNLSFKAIRRLEECEREAGILPPESPLTEVLKSHEKSNLKKPEINLGKAEIDELRMLADEAKKLINRINEVLKGV